jgi:hypothetical protein
MERARRRDSQICGLGLRRENRGTVKEAHGWQNRTIRKFLSTIMTADNGGAPCVWHGILSLAICKPVIRRTAGADDLVFGFGEAKLGGSLIYIAKVTKKLPPPIYYRRKKYSNRPDCIYHRKGNQLQWKDNARFHLDGSGKLHDIGSAPAYNNGFVLLSNDFRYFGKKGTCDHRKKYGHLFSLLKPLKRGDRVNLNQRTQDDLIELKREKWRRFNKKRIGPPSNFDARARCSFDEGVATGEVC